MDQYSTGISIEESMKKDWYWTGSALGCFSSLDDLVRYFCCFRSCCRRQACFPESVVWSEFSLYFKMIVTDQLEHPFKRAPPRANDYHKTYSQKERTSPLKYSFMESWGTCTITVCPRLLKQFLLSLGMLVTNFIPFYFGAY